MKKACELKTLKMRLAVVKYNRPDDHNCGWQHATHAIVAFLAISEVS